jgi:hypothetical protein
MNQNPDQPANLSAGQKREHLAALLKESASSTNGDHSQEEIMTRAFVYRSRFRDWDSLASVRGGPRRLLEDEEAKGKVYFSTRLTPYVHHPLVVRLGPEAQRALVIHRLYHYLDFTANFEIEVVNRAAQRIAMGMTGFDLPAEMASDAYKIYCDEGYHSFFSIDLKLQVQAATGVTPLPYNFDRFLRRLYKASEKVPANLKPIASLLTVIVFETLISLILNKLPKDQQVVSAVRQVISDHADDEARHHAFFSSFFEFLWPQLSGRQRSTLGLLLPHFIVKSLEPDYDSIKQCLAVTTLKPDEIDQVVEECYPWKSVIADLRNTASATLRLFKRNGVFDDLPTYEAFQASGLID